MTQCTIVLCGSTPELCRESARACLDALGTVEHLRKEGADSGSPIREVPGAGCCEMLLAHHLRWTCHNPSDSCWFGHQVLADALEYLPRCLIRNSGGRPALVMDLLRRLAAQDSGCWGVQATSEESGNGVVNVLEAGIMDSYATKKTVVRAACDCAIAALDLLSVEADGSSAAWTP